MSNLEGDSETFAMVTGVPVASSGLFTNSKRLTDIVELTLSDDEKKKNIHGVEQGQNDNDTEDESDHDSDVVMLDGPPPSAPIYNAPLDMDSFQPDPILPSEIEWPFIMNVNKDTSRHLIPLQFVDPSLFGRHLDILNPRIRFTRAQYKAAWVYAVNQCRDKVDLTATLAANPGLDQSSFVKLIDDEFEKVLVNDYGVNYQTRAEELEAIRSEIKRTTGKEHKKMLHAEKKLSNTKAKRRMTKNEIKALKAAAESQARVLGRGPPTRHIARVVYEDLSRQQVGEAPLFHQARRVVMDPDGTWYTVANTQPRASEGMLELNNGGHSSLPAAAVDHPMSDQDLRRIQRAPAPPPTLIPASAWYSPPEPQVSRNVSTGSSISRNSDYTPFNPYTPTRFSSNDILYNRPPPQPNSTPPFQDSYHSDSESYRQHPAHQRSEPRYETESYRPQYNSNPLPRRPRSPPSYNFNLPRQTSRRSGYTQPVAYGSSPSSLTLTLTPASLPPRPPRGVSHMQGLTPASASGYLNYGSPEYEYPGQRLGSGMGMGVGVTHGVAVRYGGVRLGSGVRSRWEEERDAFNVIVKVGDDGGDGDVEMRGGYETLPESRDEHEKYYVKKPDLEIGREYEDDEEF